MDEYLIGAGAVLTAGPTASIAAATLHAQTDWRLAERIDAALIDFEGARATELSRIVIVASGWSGSRFHADVVKPLLSRRECSLADVISTLAAATGSREVHLFARWLLDEATALALEKRGIRVLAHPLQAIGQAALISGQRFERWRSPFRAA
jgi:hypothetical protein